MKYISAAVSLDVILLVIGSMIMSLFPVENIHNSHDLKLFRVEDVREADLSLSALSSLG